VLRFTANGAVEAPGILQIRITERFEGRIGAGAPQPTASISAESLASNLAFFSTKRGVRERRCTALVISGTGVGADPELMAPLCAAPGMGFERITRHLPPGDAQAFLRSPIAQVVTSVAIPVRMASETAAVGALASGHSAHVTAVVPLDAQGVARCAALAVALGDARPDRVVFTWPLTGERPPPAGQAARAAEAACDMLASMGVAAGIKGLPACRLKEPHRLWRSANRWYVDVDHQCHEALLFFPSVVRFVKGDACRFCAADARCDGAPAAWVEAGLAGPFEPVQS
jgi:hypothetical protein